jgi:hypothetical protein
MENNMQIKHQLASMEKDKLSIIGKTTGKENNTKRQFDKAGGFLVETQRFFLRRMSSLHCSEMFAILFVSFRCSG